MTGIREKSPYLNLSKREVDIRYNIFLLGPILTRLPNPIRFLGKIVIKLVPPNILFEKIRLIYFNYMMEHGIYKLK